METFSIIKNSCNKSNVTKNSSVVGENLNIARMGRGKCLLILISTQSRSLTFVKRIE